MNFLTRLFSRAPETSGIVLTKPAAEAARTIMRSDGLPPARTSLMIGGRPPGGLTIEFSTDPAIRRAPGNDVFVRHGVFVVVPHAIVTATPLVLIDLREGYYNVRTTVEWRPDPTPSSDPGNFAVSRKRCLRLWPGLGAEPFVIDRVGRQLRMGDTRAAVVVSLRPLVVAAYTDEMCDVALVRYPDAAAAGLEVGARLVTCNFYSRGDAFSGDLVSRRPSQWTHFAPLIADFVSDDRDAIEARKAAISEKEWADARRCARAALARAAGRYRDGRPGNTGEPAY